MRQRQPHERHGQRAQLGDGPVQVLVVGEADDGVVDRAPGLPRGAERGGDPGPVDGGVDEQPRRRPGDVVPGQASRQGHGGQHLPQVRGRWFGGSGKAARGHDAECRRRASQTGRQESGGDARGAGFDDLRSGEDAGDLGGLRRRHDTRPRAATPSFSAAISGTVSPRTPACSRKIGVTAATSGGNRATSSERPPIPASRTIASARLLAACRTPPSVNRPDGDR